MREVNLFTLLASYSMFDTSVIVWPSSEGHELSFVINDNPLELFYVVML